MYDLVTEIRSRMRTLDAALREFGKRGREYAEAERKYRMELSKKILLERDKGTPVTIINDVCRGDPEIARLRFNRDVAEVCYKSAQEAINIYKLNIKVTEEQIKREWGAGNE